ncbi:MAG: ATP-grasp domain-containing protein [Pseudomonadales bacterium]|nr:ATP-grasp domain-containing protein [Pseudomonadales bacterium]
MKKLLIANRGEIAIRIARAAHELGIQTAAIFSAEDTHALHRIKADTAIDLEGASPGAYLDIEQIIQLANQHGCDAIHPGYGFLSENASFALACAENHITFIGPDSEQLTLFGDKTSARQLAKECGVPLVLGTVKDTSLEEARDFFNQLPDNSDAILKAVSGGGGRGMRIVDSLETLEKVFERCKSEAKNAFGNDAVYIEQLIPHARHIEIQVIGDGQEVTHLWDRECSIQRNHQKIIEVAPSPSLTGSQRQPLINAALKMAQSKNYLSLGTFEFLVDTNNPENFYFIEANPRLQVEHTITEEVTGFDLVQAQLKIADNSTLADLKVPTQKPAGYAIQCRINMETLSKKGRFKPTGGNISVFEIPSGPGVRVDHFGYAGYKTSTRFDSLLAKLIVHSANSYADVIKKARRALAEFRIEGFETNISFLQLLMEQPAFIDNNIYTRFIDDNFASFDTSQAQPILYFKSEENSTPAK